MWGDPRHLVRSNAVLREEHRLASTAPQPLLSLIEECTPHLKEGHCRSEKLHWRRVDNV